MVYFLKGMCEGFIDDVTSTTYACTSLFDSAYDYTFPNLVYDASGGNFSSILICKTEIYLQNGKKVNFKDKDGNAFRYALRLTTPMTATFGRIIKNDIYEAYKFVKRDI